MVLIDLMIKASNAWRPSGSIARDLPRLAKIRHLMVDLNIFGAVPIELWAEFELDVLTIVFYTSSIIEDHRTSFYDITIVWNDDEENFQTPAMNSKLGKRAE